MKFKNTKIAHLFLLIGIIINTQQVGYCADHDNFGRRKPRCVSVCTMAFIGGAIFAGSLLIATRRNLHYSDHLIPLPNTNLINGVRCSHKLESSIMQLTDGSQNHAEWRKAVKRDELLTSGIRYDIKHYEVVEDHRIGYWHAFGTGYTWNFEFGTAQYAVISQQCSMQPNICPVMLPQSNDTCPIPAALNFSEFHLSCRNTDARTYEFLESHRRFKEISPYHFSNIKERIKWFGSPLTIVEATDSERTCRMVAWSSVSFSEYKSLIAKEKKRKAATKKHK